jgi:hypothetical protein
MSKPITYSPLPDPGGLTPEQWARDVRLLKSKGWLQDPASFEKSVADPARIAAYIAGGDTCLQCCWRGKCKKAKRCVHIMNLAIRENRHKIWPKTWKRRAEKSDFDELAVLTPADRLPRIPTPPASSAGE